MTNRESDFPFIRAIFANRSNCGYLLNVQTRKTTPWTRWQVYGPRYIDYWWWCQLGYVQGTKCNHHCAINQSNVVNWTAVFGICFQWCVCVCVCMCVTVCMHMRELERDRQTGFTYRWFLVFCTMCANSWIGMPTCWAGRRGGPKSWFVLKVSRVLVVRDGALWLFTVELWETSVFFPSIHLVFIDCNSNK